MVNVFQTYHPAVAFAYLACAIVLSMAAMHPVFVALSVAGAIVCSFVTRGARASIRAFAWVIPLVLVVAVANMLLSSSGATELFRFGYRSFSLESLIYGVCAGGMLAATLLWFASYSVLMNSESSMALLGNVAPHLTLMVSHALRLVPQFIARGRVVSAVQDANSAASTSSKQTESGGGFWRARQRISDASRVMSVLMGWGMEDGLSRSDAMHARGYACGVRRTTYKRFRFCMADGVVVLVVIVLAASSAFAMVVACSAIRFYPFVSGFVGWWAYAPYTLLMALPVVLHVKEWLLWQSLK